MRSAIYIFVFVVGCLSGSIAGAQTIININSKHYTSDDGIVNITGNDIVNANTDVVVTAGAHVTYQANTRITLGAGFTASAGSYFHASAGTGGPGGTPDTQPPTAPGNLRGTSTATTVMLTWDASHDDSGIVFYHISRAGAATQVISGTTYTEGGLTPATTYSYTVTAYDPSGNPSPSVSTDVTTASAPQNDGVDFQVHRPLQPPF